MKNRRYISFTLLLLFVAATVCRLSTSFFCSCEEDHKHDEVHVCCDCTKHIADCNYHDKTIKEKSCIFHYSVDDYIAELPFVESGSSKANSTEPIILFLAYALFDGDDDDLCKNEFNGIDHYLFHVSEWGGVSCPLRAPPVLV